MTIPRGEVGEKVAKEAGVRRGEGEKGSCAHMVIEPQN